MLSTWVFLIIETRQRPADVRRLTAGVSAVG